MLLLTRSQINKLVDYICKEYDCDELCKYCRITDCEGKVTAHPTNGQPIFPPCAEGMEAEEFFYWEDWLYDMGYETDEQQSEFLTMIGVFIV